VSDGDLHYLNLLPTLFSVHGTGQAIRWDRLPRRHRSRVLDLYWWQPVGNTATAVPMNHSADQARQSWYTF